MTPLAEITLISLGLSLMIAVIYRFLTNPASVREVKANMKFYKEKMSQAQKEGDRAKASEYASEMLKASQKQLRFSMKPMMVTLLIFVFLLSWLSSTYSGVEATFGNESSRQVTLRGQEYRVMYENATGKTWVDLNRDGAFSESEGFATGQMFTTGSSEPVEWEVKKTVTGFVFSQAEKPSSVTFSMIVARTPFTFPLIGSYLSWFWLYVFISIPATVVFRKLLGVE